MLIFFEHFYLLRFSEKERQRDKDILFTLMIKHMKTTHFLSLLASVWLLVLSSQNLFGQSPTAVLEMPDTICETFFRGIIGGGLSHNDPTTRYEIRSSDFLLKATNTQGRYDRGSNFSLSAISGRPGVFSTEFTIDDGLLEGSPVGNNNIDVVITLIVTNAQGISDTITDTSFVATHYRHDDRYDYPIHVDANNRARIPLYVCNGDTLNTGTYAASDYKMPIMCKDTVYAFDPTNARVAVIDSIKKTVRLVVDGLVRENPEFRVELDCPTCNSRLSRLKGAIDYDDQVDYVRGGRITIIDPIFCSTDSVWPGDTNNDGVCDINDLLPIGFKFGDTTNQATMSTAWQPNFVFSAPDTLMNGVNIKHVDANGSGFIDLRDTLAILTHYGNTHNKTNERRSLKTGPPIKVELPAGPFSGGDEIIADILLGDGATTADDVYGLIMKLDLSASIVDSVSWYDPLQSTWLGAKNSDMLSLLKHLPADRRVDVGFVRNDRTERSGSGRIGQIKLHIAANISQDTELKVDFADAVITSFDGSESSATAFADAVMVSRTTGIVKQFDASAVDMFPNPASKRLHIHSKLTQAGTLRIFSLTGQQLLQTEVEGNREAELDISALAPGAYHVSLQTPDGVWRSTLLKGE